jgi:heat shock protein HslJ
MVKISAGLLIVASAITLVGCAPGASTRPLHGEWILTSGSDSTGTFDGELTDVTLVIDADGVSGRICNSYGGTLSGSPADLRVESLFSTEMYCTTPEGIMDLEQRFLTDLGAVTGASVEGGQLTLTGPSITLGFTAAD